MWFVKNLLWFSTRTLHLECYSSICVFPKREYELKVIIVILFDVYLEIISSFKLRHL